jgi:hypothetical protein
VSHSHFDFTLRVSDEPAFRAMLEEVSASVFGQLGYSPSIVADLVASLSEALVGGAAEGPHPCAIGFSVQAGELSLVVSREDGAEWRVSRPLPVR